MEKQSLLSAGIDIGTSTTQLIFSRLDIENTGGFGRIPEIKITSKEIIYKSAVYFTPLLSQSEIDEDRVLEIIKNEYKRAGIKPSDIKTGAVIITGESSLKKNAATLTEKISKESGDFIAAAAGSDLEAVLAGMGSGAGRLSEKTGKITVNFDIGGGTSNICFFKDGEAVETGCLDIGGRLIKIKEGIISYIAPKIKTLIKTNSLEIKEGEKADIHKLKKLTDIMASVLAEAVSLSDKKYYDEFLNTEHAMKQNIKPEIISFSGGVAECFNESDSSIFKYGDIGILLAESVKNNRDFKKAEIKPAEETLRATVIGAGNYAVNISGSTVYYTDKDMFPVKNIPAVKIKLESEDDISKIKENLLKEVNIYINKENENTSFAVSMKGIRCPSFKNIQNTAREISEFFDENCWNQTDIIIIMEEDAAKALGQALGRFVKNKRKIISLDSIKCSSGDYIDLGKPEASGSIIPVVVKTLIFGGS